MRPSTSGRFRIEKRRRSNRRRHLLEQWSSTVPNAAPITPPGARRYPANGKAARCASRALYDCETDGDDYPIWQSGAPRRMRRARSIVGLSPAEHAKLSREKQGLPPHITDAATLRRIAQILQDSATRRAESQRPVVAGPTSTDSKANEMTSRRSAGERFGHERRTDRLP